MADLNLERMDRRIELSQGIHDHSGPIQPVWTRPAYRQGYLDGMRAALKIPVDVSDLKTQEQIFFASGGVLRKNILIRSAIRRLRKEMKANAEN
jgi:hypothetical protein